jgi:arabinofuranosyltransferase
MALKRVTAADAAVFALMGAFLVVLVRTAWMCDDAFISLRTVDNFVHGYGLRWNVDERVQVFTHPLWLFVVSAFYAVTREPYFTVLAVSMALSLTAVWVYARGTAADATTAAVGLLLLTLSKSFMDYSTSGLENPLTHLLIALFFAVAYRGDDAGPKRLMMLSILTGLLSVDRLDTVLLVAPALSLRVAQVGLRRSWRPLALGAVPFLAWELFSIVYYGLPFPNTAYAKLGGDVLRSERLIQGFIYVLDAFSMDPLTPVVIGLGIAVPLILRDRASLAAAAGVLLSLTYVVAIGGDFMSGRLLSATFFVAVITLTRIRWAGEPKQLAAVVGVAVMLGIGAVDPDILTGKDCDGIVDERRVYYPYTGLLNVLTTGTALTHPWADDARRVVAEGRRVVKSGANGFFGYVIGRDVHVIDRYALGDAFLARLPAEPGWNPGHVARRIPAGYEDTIATGRNLIAEQGIAALCDRMFLITRGPLFTARRWHAIWRLHVDGYHGFLAGTSYDVRTVEAHALGAANPSSEDQSGGELHIREAGVLVHFDRPLRGNAIDVVADGNDDFFLFHLLGNDVIGRTIVHREWEGEPSRAVTRRVAAPSSALVFDRVLIRPRRTWGAMALRSVRPCE